MERNRNTSSIDEYIKKVSKLLPYPEEKKKLGGEITAGAEVVKYIIRQIEKIYNAWQYDPALYNPGRHIGDEIKEPACEAGGGEYDKLTGTCR